MRQHAFLVLILLFAYANTQGKQFFMQSSTEIWQSAGSKASVTPLETVWIARWKTGISNYHITQSKFHDPRTLAQDPRILPRSIRY